MLLLVSNTLSHAVMPYALSTDSNGAFISGGWTGNGTVQPNINPGTYTGTTIEGILVQDFSSGVLSVDIAGDLITTGRLKDPNQGAVHTITLIGGGTADIRLANSNGFDGGASLWNSVGLTGFSGNVTSIQFTTVFDTPVAGRSEFANNYGIGGMGAGLALINAGALQGLDSFTVGLSYGGVFSSSAGNSAGPYNPSLPGFVSGVPSGAIPSVSNGFVAGVAGATSFTSNAFTGLDQFLLVKGYDYDGSGNAYQADDGDNVYITSMTWTITKDNNLFFSPDTLFVVSMDGQQYGTSFVPEPSSVILGLTGVALFAFRRRRA